MNNDDIVQLFSNWNDAIQTGDPDKVTAMYAEDAVLLPTVSNQVRHNHSEIRDYFVSFLAKSPSGEINESNPRQLTDDLVSNTGVYTFTFGDGAQVMARYSYLYKRIGGEWKILEHHSSMMPEPV
ncbi:MAG: SgcJ/EcaC family oxidoreductase [Halieaceae bacterium]|jgi:uncharacterized protein (TIGR02246 family)